MAQVNTYKAGSRELFQDMDNMSVHSGSGFLNTSGSGGRHEINDRFSDIPLIRLSMALLIPGLVFAAAAGLILLIVFGGAHLFGLGGSEWVGILNIAGVAIILVMITSTLLIVAERKWSARMQNRVGPNRARLFRNQKWPFYGIPHLAADGLKMIFKEDFVPPTAQKFLFNIAPVISFVPAFALIAVVPIGPDIAAFGTDIRFQVARLDMGLLFIFAVASIGVFGTTIAGWSSNNNFGMLGALRAGAQMISYEVALVLTLVGAVIIYQTLRLEEMVAFQDRSIFGFIPAWGIFFQPFAFIFFLCAAFAEVKRAPFDLPEAESEIIGYFVEYSGMKFGLFMFAEFIEITALAAIITVLFFGGWSIPWISHDSLFLMLSEGIGLGSDWGALCAAFIGLMVFIVKMMFFVWLQMVIRWSFPRFRYDQLMDIGWKALLPLSLMNVIITSVLVVLDGSLNLLLAAGILQILILVLIIAKSDAPRREMLEKALNDSKE